MVFKAKTSEAELNCHDVTMRQVPPDVQLYVSLSIRTLFRCHGPSQKVMCHAKKYFIWSFPWFQDRWNSQVFQD